MAQTWIVRAGRDDEFERPAIEEGLVVFGWRRVGDLTNSRTQAAIRALVDKAYWDVSLRSRQIYAAQLFAFRAGMRAGDYVVLLRGNAPDLAVGVVTGEYAFRDDLPGSHIRTVRWLRTDVRRTEIGADLLAAPALTNIYKIRQADAAQRLASMASLDALSATASPETLEPTGPAAITVQPATATTPFVALDNFRRNLDYALSLATAGLHLQRLKVEAFEVADVFRAAWVQAVAALDHWVHQEIRERLLARAQRPAPDTAKHLLTLGIAGEFVNEVAVGSATIEAAVEKHFAKAFGKATFQQPKQIGIGFAKVADVAQLWPRVARVLTERAADGAAQTADEIEAQLSTIVVRRNKIAHEYDEDPANPPNKRPIDATVTTQTVEWIGRLAEAIAVALDNPA